MQVSLVPGYQSGLAYRPFMQGVNIMGDFYIASGVIGFALILALVLFCIRTDIRRQRITGCHVFDPNTGRHRFLVAGNNNHRPAPRLFRFGRP